jgi:hypothetical protein
MRSRHRCAAGSGVTTIAGIASRARAGARSSDVRFSAVAAVPGDWAAAAKGCDRIEAGIQCTDRVGCRIKRRRIGYRGTSGARVARSYDHLDPSSFLSLHSSLQLVADNATLRDQATPGVNCNVRRLGRVAFVRRAVKGIRRKEKFHALDVPGWCAVPLVHVTATDPFCAGRHSDLVGAAVITDCCASCVRAVEEIITGLLRIIPARISHTIVNGIVPVKIVIGVDAVPAAVMRLKRVMRPANAGVGTGNHDGFSLEAKRPYIRRVGVSNAGFDRRRSSRQQR